MKKMLLLTMGLLLLSCQAKEPSRSQFALGTVCTISLYDAASNGLYQRIFERLNEIEQKMSSQLASSVVGEINRKAGIEAVAVPSDLFTVIEQALQMAQLSAGSFDPSIGVLVEQWGIGSEAARLPKVAEIAALLPLVDYRQIEINPTQQTVFLVKKGMKLDLGAIAKGYAADEAARLIKEAKVPYAIVNLGGDVVLVGQKPDGMPWKIGVQDPLKGKDDTLGIVTTAPAALVTSGVYERFFIQDGVRYHHLLSPFNGYPSQNGLLSVSVLAKTAMVADALSTALFIMDYQEAVNLLEQLDDVEALFVFNDLTVRQTAGLDFKLTNSNYSY